MGTIVVYVIAAGIVMFWIIENMQNNTSENKGNWFKQHADTVMFLAGILASVLWMNGKFNDVDRHFYEIDSEIKVIKAVLCMKNILPSELAKKKEG